MMTETVLKCISNTHKHSLGLKSAFFFSEKKRNRKKYFFSFLHSSNYDIVTWFVSRVDTTITYNMKLFSVHPFRDWMKWKNRYDGIEHWSAKCDTHPFFRICFFLLCSQWDPFNAWQCSTIFNPIEFLINRFFPE